MPLDNKALFELDLSCDDAHSLHRCGSFKPFHIFTFSNNSLTHIFSLISIFDIFIAFRRPPRYEHNDDDAGYGNIAPATEEGKIATIFYAIIGMPLFLLYLSNIGNLLLGLTGGFGVWGVAVSYVTVSFYRFGIKSI